MFCAPEEQKKVFCCCTKTFAQRIPSEKASPETRASQPEAGGTPGGAELLTQLVGGGDNVSGDARVQISVHDAERVQLGHVVPSDLKGGDNSTRAHPGQGEEEEQEEEVKEVETRCSEQKAVRRSRMESGIRKIKGL